jgi:hypothetical protein
MVSGNRRIRLPLLAVLGAALVAVLVAACGGSEKLSKQELAKKADGICREQRVQSVRQLGPGPNFPSAVAVYDAGFLRIAEPIEKRLRDLEPPDAEAKTWKAYLAARDVSTELTRSELRAAKRGDQRKLQAIGGARQKSAQKRSALAGKLGLKVCSAQAAVENLLGAPEPAGPPPQSTQYVKPKDTLDDALAAFSKVKTCGQLRALQNSDDPPVPAADCKNLIPALAGFKPTAKEELGPVGVADFVARSGQGTVLFVEDAKDGRLKFATVIANEGGAVHKPTNDNAARNMNAALVALRTGDAAKFRRVTSENTSLYAKPPAEAVKLEGPTGSGPRFIKDLKADPGAKPQPLGVDQTFGFFAVKANGNDYVLVALKGPTGYKFEGFYPQPSG